MKFGGSVALVALAAVVLGGCVKENPDYCDETDTTCPEGKICDITNNVCIPGGKLPGLDGGASPDVSNADGGPEGEAGSQADARATGDGGISGDAGDASLGKARGESCGSSDECASNNCVDRVCCSASACSDCQACNVSGKEGSCHAIADGTPPPGQCAHDTECGPATCQGGACSFVTGIFCRESCTNDTHTTFTCGTSGRCEPSATSCGAMACADDRKACRTGGCITHAHCSAASACDRSKAHQTGEGFCIDPNDVLATVTSGAELEAIVLSTLEENPPSEAMRYVLLDPGTYATAVAVQSGRLTFIGLAEERTGVTIQLTDNEKVEVRYSDELVLQRLTISGGWGVSCEGYESPPTHLAVIESHVEESGEYGIESQMCDLEIRRSTVAQNRYCGARVNPRPGGSVAITNSLFHGNDGRNAEASGVELRLGTDRVSLALTNNTILGGAEDAVACTAGGGSYNNDQYVFRNSILVRYAVYYSCAAEFSATAETDPCALSDYRPSAAPCVNGGDNASAGGLKLDHDNKPRIQGGTVDIGAFEVQ
jgi:hypothetical protein